MRRPIPLATICLLLLAAGCDRGSRYSIEVGAIESVEWDFPSVVIAGEPAWFEWQYLRDGVAVTEGAFDCVFDPGDGRSPFDVAECGPSGRYDVVYDGPLGTAVADIAPTIEVRRAAASSGPGGETTSYLVPSDGEPYHLRLVADVTQGPAPLAVTFDALAVYSGDPTLAEDAVCVLEFERGTTATARSWPCDPDRGPIVQRSGIETTYPVAGTYTAQLLVYEPPWPVDGGFAAIEVDIDVR